MSFRTSSQARAAAHTSWARTPDRTARTEKARAAAKANLEREVDPYGRMSPKDRAKAVKNAQAARMHTLSQKGVDARQRQRAKARKKAGA